ncbi:hypothetical protein [Mariniluteicoccus flavus]
MLIHSRDLEARGLTRSEVLARVRRGEARQVRPGVWSLDDPDTPEGLHRELLAATAPGLRDGAVLSHVSAAVLHGLPVPKAALDRVHLTRAGEGGKRSRFLHLHRGKVPDADLVELDGFVVTGLERTAVDLARTLSPMDALAAADVAVGLGVERDAALARIAAMPRWPGNPRARNAFVHADARAESPGESWSRWRMIELGVPLPDLQVTLFDADGFEVARPDFLWKEAGLVGEFDGAIKYGRCLKPGQSIADVIMAEKEREERIRRLGYWIVRWTAAELFPPSRFRRLLLSGWTAGKRPAA